MITSTQITPGMTISLEGKIYRVESAVKVTLTKGVPFIKTKLKNLQTEEISEKSFKTNQEVEEVSLTETSLEFLYTEGKDYLFLDTLTLDQVLVPAMVVGDKAHFLKEGVEVKAMVYGSSIFSIELPQFLELMVVKVESVSPSMQVTHSTKPAILETGARVEVPMFIDSGDVVKVDAHTGEFVQRV